MKANSKHLGVRVFTQGRAAHSPLIIPGSSHFESCPLPSFTTEAKQNGISSGCRGYGQNDHLLNQNYSLCSSCGSPVSYLTGETWGRSFSQYSLDGLYSINLPIYLSVTVYTYIYEFLMYIHIYQFSYAAEIVEDKAKSA